MIRTATHEDMVITFNNLKVKDIRAINKLESSDVVFYFIDNIIVSVTRDGETLDMEEMEQEEMEDVMEVIGSHLPKKA